MLAWAVTIHKSQGKTFSNVIIDTGGGTFADGQMYVALSRCTSLEGVVLKRLFSKRQVRTNFQVAEFLSRFQDGVTKESNPADERVHIIREAIKNKIPLEIVYQNSNNEQSVRTVMPVVVGTMGFRGRTYQGMQAFCLNRKELRSFRLDRILEIR
jgi:ethanolamine utilization protein EutP (predicted NTPase)